MVKVPAKHQHHYGHVSMLLLAFSSSDTYKVLTFDIGHYFYLEKPVWTQIRCLKEYFEAASVHYIMQNLCTLPHCIIKFHIGPKHLCFYLVKFHLHVQWLLSAVTIIS